MEAYGKTIIVSEIKEEVKSKNGIIITDPNGTEVRYKLGKVITFGDEVKGIEKGGEIYYDKTHAGDIRLNGSMYKIINTGDVRVIM